MQKIINLIISRLEVEEVILSFPKDKIILIKEKDLMPSQFKNKMKIIRLFSNLPLYNNKS
jgi:hypothetical protein